MLRVVVVLDVVMFFLLALIIVTDKWTAASPQRRWLDATLRATHQQPGHWAMAHAYHASKLYPIVRPGSSQ